MRETVSAPEPMAEPPAEAAPELPFAASAEAPAMPAEPEAQPEPVEMAPASEPQSEPELVTTAEPERAAGPPRKGWWRRITGTE